MCTTEKTYEVKAADTSNSLFMGIPDPAAATDGNPAAIEIQGIAKEYVANPFLVFCSSFPQHVMLSQSACTSIIALLSGRLVASKC
jgi:hypothetical protein